ncbi:aldo/keto reductase [Domibacillus indicus]|uniref:aldo/keto reductase n=1 Tax=Domibacillus indicus TaxID=1437523 RepID=UPI0006181671|nr:aldo/keto reductase [Domibacillus indicus]
MKKLPIEKHGLNTSRLVLGCMGFGGGWSRDAITEEQVKQAHEAVNAALESGINFFDHADIYAFGKAEEVFGRVLKERPGLRDEIFIQSKTGITFPDKEAGLPTRYNFSKEYILNGVDGTLSRLGTDHLDTLLLHRPDALMEPEEVAEAFHALKSSGKVRYFGVSNMSAGQIKLLQSAISDRLVVNQLEMSLHKIGWLESGVHVNQPEFCETIFPEGTLEYCRMENIQIQAWGPLAQGLYSGASLEGKPAAVKETAGIVKKMAQEKETTTEAIVLAWLMRHPAMIQPVIGTTSPERIRASAKAMNVVLSRDEWYTLYVSSRGVNLP